MTLEFEVGDAVVLLTDIYEEGEDLPPGVIANKGDVVYIREEGTLWDYNVAHKGRKGSFGVNKDEFRLTPSKMSVVDFSFGPVAEVDAKHNQER